MLDRWARMQAELYHLRSCSSRCRCGRSPHADQRLAAMGRRHLADSLSEIVARLAVLSSNSPRGLPISRGPPPFRKTPTNSLSPRMLAAVLAPQSFMGPSGLLRKSQVPSSLSMQEAVVNVDGHRAYPDAAAAARLGRRSGVVATACSRATWASTRSASPRTRRSSSATARPRSSTRASRCSRRPAGRSVGEAQRRPLGDVQPVKVAPRRGRPRAVDPQRRPRRGARRLLARRPRPRRRGRAELGRHADPHLEARRQLPARRPPGRPARHGLADDARRRDPQRCAAAASATAHPTPRLTPPSRPQAASPAPAIDRLRDAAGTSHASATPPRRLLAARARCSSTRPSPDEDVRLARRFCMCVYPVPVRGRGERHE